MNRSIDELKLQAELLAGDLSVFWELWEIYKSSLFHICLRMMNGSRYEAEDALSKAMLKAWEKLPVHIANINNFRGWLTQLTHNVCIDLLRKKKNKNEILFDNFPDGIVYTDREFFMDVSQSPENKFLGEKKLQIICQEINRLPARLREPMMLHFFLQMPYKEIAFEFNITGVNVRKRIQQARDLLKEKLKAHIPDLTLRLSMGIKMPGDSSTWVEASREAGLILQRYTREIRHDFSASRLLPVSCVEGIERSAVIFLESIPQRIKTRIKTLGEYVRRYPGGWKKQVELADLLYAEGSWNQAIQQYRSALEKHPLVLHGWFNLGFMFLKTGEPANAEEVYRKAIDYARKPATRHYISGMLHLCRREWNLALQAFRQAVELEPLNSLFLFQAALCYLQGGHVFEALEVIEKALQINPHDLLILTCGYECLARTGRNGEAGKLVERVLELYPGDIQALKRSADCRCRRGLFEGEEGRRTRLILRQLARSAPHVVEVHESIAIYHYYQGDNQQALGLLKDYLREHPGAPAGWRAYALWLYRCGFYGEAAEAVMRSYSLDKQDLGVFCMACKIFPNAGMLEPLKPILRNMLLDFPRHWLAVGTAGFTMVEAYNETRRGLDLSRQAIELQHRLPEAYVSHARTLVAAGEFSQAVNIIKEGSQYLPYGDCCECSVSAARLLARCCKTLGNNEQARGELKKVIRGAGQIRNHAPAWGFYLEGMALLELGYNEKAADALDNARAHGLFHPYREEVEKIIKKIRR